MAEADNRRVNVFDVPTGLVIDKDDNVYVTDPTYHFIGDGKLKKSYEAV